MKVYPFACLKEIGRKIILNLKDKSNVTLRLWTDQCEYIMAQRFRRGQQISSFYYNIWGEHALKELLRGFRRQIQRHVKGVLLSSVGLYVFDWDSERIGCDIIRNYFTEIDFVECLKKETLICSKCGKRRLVEEKSESIDYCNCPSSGTKKQNKLQGWEPYLERSNMIVWRKEEKSSLFAYKVYAKYDDISASDFLHVQTDIVYRKEWDDSAVSLEIVDTDPLDTGKSHVVYWEMKWPKLFANRDYVYCRRHLFNENRNLVVICNKSTAHPSCPIDPNKQRVNNYWSYMVIKPLKSFDEPGLEFVLTYFDDPGLALPSTITSWVAQKQMPDYLNKLYIATKKYAEHKKTYRTKPSPWGGFKTTAEYINTPKSDNRDYHSRKKTELLSEVEQESSGTSTEESQESGGEDGRKRRWWSYLYFNYYFV